jgi:hypothetical protein
MTRSLCGVDHRADSLTRLANVEGESIKMESIGHSTLVIPSALLEGAPTSSFCQDNRLIFQLLAGLA